MSDDSISNSATTLESILWTENVEPNFKKASPFSHQIIWKSREHFLFLCFGYIISFADINRFTIRCLKYGGTTFFIARFLITMTVILPILLIEITIGQFTNRNFINCWSICKGFRGISYTMCMLNYLYLYINIVQSTYAGIYLYYSFFPNVPWNICNNEWNDRFCIPSGEGNMKKLNSSYEMSTVQFYKRYITNVEKNVNGHYVRRSLTDYPDGIVLYLYAASVLLLCFSMFIIVFGHYVWKHIYRFLTVYSVINIILMIIFGVQLKEADIGLKYFTIPDMKMFLNVNMWKMAVEESIINIGIGFGSFITLASYNEYHYDLNMLALYIILADTAVGFMSVIAAFEFYGHLSYRINLDISQIKTFGVVGLLFLAFSEGFLNFSNSSLLYTTFFFAAISLSFTSMLITMKVLITNLSQFVFHNYTVIRNVCLSILVHLVLIVTMPLFVSTTGCLWIEYVSGKLGAIVLLITLIESVIIGYIYGLDNFSHDYYMMQGKHLSRYYRICILLCCPIALLFLLTYSLLLNESIIDIVALDCAFYIVTIGSIPYCFFKEFIHGIKDLHLTYISALKQCFKPDIFYGPNILSQWTEDIEYNKKLKLIFAQFKDDEVINKIEKQNPYF